MKNIFASISWLDEIISMGLPQDKYLAVRLRAFYQYGTNRGMDSDAALSYAKERLKYNLDKAGKDGPKAGKEKPVVEEKSIYKKDPSSIRPKVKKENKSLSEDEILDSRISTLKSGVRELVDNKLREIVGDVSDEEFTKVQNLFKREKTQSGLTNREALEEVARITGKQRAKSVKKEEIVPVEREQHQSDFDTSQDHNLYDFIKSMDPSNAERNLVLFKKYRLQGYRVSTALERIRKVGELREFCNANNIPIELATRFINVYPNLEDAKRELLQWKSQGGFGLETNMLPMSKSYFIDNSKNVDENNLIIYTSEVYGWVNQQRYAMCYNLGKGGTYNEILDLECSFEEFVHRLFSCNFSPLWDTDELYLGKCVYEFENKENNKNRITKLERGGWGEGYAAGRIDREYWGKYDFGKILEGFYIDSHLLRPYNENKEEIDKILNLLYKRNENN